MVNEEKKFSNDYLASDLQLWELAQSILSGDIDYATNLLKLFKDNKFERLREDGETHRKTLDRQREVEEKLERQVD